MPQVIARRSLRVLAALGLVALTASSAILVKEARYGNVSPAPLASVDHVSFAELSNMPVGPAASGAGVLAIVDPLNAVMAEERAVEREPEAKAAEAELPEAWPLGTRFFNGRPIRPVKTMKMVVTGYSPDARSCGKYADGRTATLHSVQTNAHRLVAADPRVLGYGSMLSIPGYDGGSVVPVLDCGSAIKGNRLDLLFPTHEQARKWGKKTVTVTVWGYADGKPAPNPRKARDGHAR